MQQKWLKKRLWLALIERRLINKAAAIHCTSILEEEQLKQWHFKPPSVVIPNPLDMTPFQQLPERGKLRQSLGIPSNGTLSLFVGRLHKMKRLGLMIEAFAKVTERISDGHLLIVGPEGDGSGERAKKQVFELGLSDRVHFAGMLTGAPLMQAYADADMLVLLSYRENFGMVVAEAMAAGLPVLVSREVGLAEEVAQAGAGFVVPAEVGQVAQAWQEILAKSDLRQAMGQRGKALVQQRFASDVVARQMLGLLASISARAVGH
jgi:glycosyltransferase involved in cell wall biosynthesis